MGGACGINRKKYQKNIMKFIFLQKNEEGMGWIVCDRVQIADPKGA